MMGNRFSELQFSNRLEISPSRQPKEFGEPDLFSPSFDRRSIKKSAKPTVKLLDVSKLDEDFARCFRTMNDGMKSE